MTWPLESLAPKETVHSVSLVMAKVASITTEVELSTVVNVNFVVETLPVTGGNRGTLATVELTNIKMQ